MIRYQENIAEAATVLNTDARNSVFLTRELKRHSSLTHHLPPSARHKECR